MGEDKITKKIPKKDSTLQKEWRTTLANDNTRVAPIRRAPYVPVNTTSEFIFDFKKGKSIQNPNAQMGLINVYPEFDILTGIGGVIKSGAYKKAYKINPLAEKLNNPNSSYRVVGSDAYDDFVTSGVVRSGDGAHTGQMFRGQEIVRPTGFPSFQKGYADLSYAPKNMKPYVFETKVPTFKRGDINPITGGKISGRHYAHRPIDMNTGKVITELPGSYVKVFDGNPHWLNGYKEIINKSK